MKSQAAGMIRSIVRQSSTLMSLSYKVRGIRPLEGLDELDRFLDECMGGEKEITPAALERMSKGYLKIPEGMTVPADPFSPEFGKFQSELYAKVAGKSYALANEAAEFDFEAAKNDFFPYSTGSGEFVGGQLQSHGFVIRNIGLPRGARIVEFGAGWGNLTVQLMLMGYRMTAVELNKPSIALMAHRAAIHGKSIDFAEQDMVEFACATDRKFDAALFLASFHHAHDHRKLIENLDRILDKNGVAYFADEPIPPAGHPALPYAWGLRLDAPTLYYVRRHGWLELGFRSAYFKELLAKHGWRCRTVPSEIRGIGDLQIATRAE
jgi:SAM-dependent methyltransferase